jgi:hypothetical protein
MLGLRKIIALLCTLLLAFSVHGAQEQRITGIYSNLYYNVEGGDLLGMELLILPSGSVPEPAFSAFVQIAGGGAPFSAIVPLNVSGKKIEFTLPTGGIYDRQHFEGTLSNTELTVRWSQGTVEHLKRGKSYWQ